MSDPPGGLSQLLTPDAIFAIAVGTAASMVAALQQQVRGWGILVSNMAGALVTASVIPLAQSRGYTWGDWLLPICLLAGVFSGTAFLLCAALSKRVLTRSDQIADKAIDKVLGPGGKP